MGHSLVMGGEEHWTDRVVIVLDGKNSWQRGQLHQLGQCPLFRRLGLLSSRH